MNLLSRYAQGAHDLELVLHLDDLTSSLPLLCSKLCHILMVCTRRRLLIRLIVRRVFVRISFEVLPKELHLIYEFVGTSLDRHSCAMETQGEQAPLALHSRKSRRELNFADCEGMPSM